MSTNPAAALKIFYCYAREDKAERDELDRHLSGLKRQYNLTTWSDIQITPGTEWEQEISTHLDSADLILLLISAHFIASEYCYGIEMQHAIKRHEAGTARVLSILLRPVYLENAPFKKLQMLPADARPISKWPDRDEAFSDITNGIARALTDLLKPTNLTKEPKEIPNSSSKIQRKPSTFGEWLTQGARFFDAAEYEKSLEAYDESLKIEPENFEALRSKGCVLLRLGRYEEAIVTFEKALLINSTDAISWNNKGTSLYYLQQYEDALEAYNTSIHHDPNYSLCWYSKGSTLKQLHRDEEALNAFNTALDIDPGYVSGWYEKAELLEKLRRYEEAVEAYRTVLYIDPDHSSAHYHLGNTLNRLGDMQQAQEHYKKARELGYKPS